MTAAELRGLLDGVPSETEVLVRTQEGDEIDRTVEVTDVVRIPMSGLGNGPMVVLVGDLDAIE